MIGPEKRSELGRNQGGFAPGEGHEEPFDRRSTQKEASPRARFVPPTKWLLGHLCVPIRGEFGVADCHCKELVFRPAKRLTPVSQTQAVCYNPCGVRCRGVDDANPVFLDHSRCFFGVRSGASCAEGSAKRAPATGTLQHR